MQLKYAVERLYQAGWSPNFSTAGDNNLETLPDGTLFPSARDIAREFSDAGLELAVKHNPKFSCYRATWAPAGEKIDPEKSADEQHGTVIGTCEREASVFALAQLLSARNESQLALV